MKDSVANQKSWTQWFEIPVLDFERAKNFYETVFDTEIHAMDLGELKMGVFPHKDVGCALCQHPDFYKPGQNGPLVYMSAEPDLQVFQDRVEAAGGSVQVPKKQISPEHGYMCVFTDSEGNRLALHSMS
ncbi:MAG: VOC family protein [Chitinophagales bacterium]